MSIEKIILSFKKNNIGILLMIFSSLFVCIGQLLWKLSHTNGYIYLIVGFGLYSIGAIIMIIAYKFGSLSVLQPILSLNYVLAIVIAYFFLNETITSHKIFGVFIITFGVVMICIGDE